jgi:N-acyl-D-aspartate/D-glutamate deacylase
VSAGGPADLVLRGGTVVDGTGAPARLADVAIRGSTIAAVGDLARSAAGPVMDVSGLVVAPGFIDAHGHSDIAVLSSPRVPSKIQQGVTTEVIGNCGLAVAPLRADTDASAVRSLLSIVDVDRDVPWRWRSVGDYLATVESAGTAMNIAMLAGHLAIRVSCCGLDDRPATAAEIDQMSLMADRALADGAVGLSSGLMYPPNAYASTDELVALGQVIAAHGALFTFHLRDYGDELLRSVAEALTVAERSGCRVQISHLATVGRRNWGKVAQALDLIDAAVSGGLDVAADIYPYLAGSTNLTQLLPRWALAGGTGRLLERLGHPAQRDRIRAEVARDRLQGWDEILVAGGDFPGPGGDPVGLSVSQLAQRRAVAPEDALLDLVAASGGSAVVVAFGRSEADLRAALRHPRVMIGSDGLGLDPDGPSGRGQPHPRSYGCYPRLLGQYVREERVLTLEEAVAKSTGAVAARFGLRDRGQVTAGMVADLVVFDPEAIADRATYTAPQQSAAGVHAVFVSGQVVLRDGRQAHTLPGAVLRRQAA